MQLNNNSFAYEEHSYTVLETFEEFELRNYDSAVVAEVATSGNFDDVGNKAFRILFNFISGKNVASESIEMTTPVIQQSTDGKKISMTTPVLLQPSKTGNGEYLFSFVMPSTYTIETIPKPLDERITLRVIPERLVAARTFTGRWTQKNYQRNEDILLNSMAEKNLRSKGEFVFARYNSPFSLWFMRRNEVLIEIER